ncbi:TetR/AcrR family transcriptional regulator [Arthrobacter sp. ISL-65]|uniref:TetR/AcrR family transcriptional regulator n=1 Tax=Arthrobacter sp. ISL-65 TaxID=2819112 RepID=UPI001BE5ED90|nr:TetR/AcrR family transcriptional regulator [Arthrobacter sp. ISL-65]MBT2547727.1 TetR/AcrR family transcriptional regulator [Arthrobacter sp. ISL-65]
MRTVADNLEDPDDVRTRIVVTAYRLFAHRGIRDVGVDELIRASGVAKATFYRHFPSKDDVALAFLKRRDELWMLGSVVPEARSRADNPEDQLLAIFDVYDQWFQDDDFEACSFVKVLLEMGPGHPLGQASIGYLGRIRQQVRLLAEEAGLEDSEAFALSWHILMKGSIIAAAEGDKLSARRARHMASGLIADHRPKSLPE